MRPRPGGSAPPAMPAGDGDATKIQRRRSPARDRLELRQVPRLRRETVAEAAASLLTLAGEIGQMQGQVDTAALHRQAVQHVRDFEARARAGGVDETTVDKSRYVLCSLLDELVLNSPWGEHSDWSQKSLLRTFHGETYGGERVFHMVDQAMATVRKDHEFLHIAYLALSLGFLGKYRLEAGGRQEVERFRGELYRELHNQRDRRKEALSPSAKPVAATRQRLQSFLPVWALMAVLAVAACGIYGNWLIELNQASDGVRAELAAIVPQPAQEEPVSADRVPPTVVELRELLAPEIERGVVAVEAFPNRVRVVLRAGELFDSGDAAVDPALHPVLDKIARALEIVPGRITVAGHTDDRAIRTPRYPSNWHLSLARATNVAEYMDQAANLQGRLVPEGRGATEPVADNATAEGRAQNRRVTLSVSLGGAERD
ncbi:type VI secretion system protein TssL, long form [Aquisalimonas lutea]|uniref:type VI secretion system protein TssL, long form n=1 Tax=Aquisalimonas lutea TaxID=1327750 RepID=UPI0025B4CAE6|nr:type VI secretion system protein TssL, long form [Aquisalimonas lutea]MDN3519587.1 type VI secretion system protein TssL, long form [Aquisalimonas lutea]